MLDADETTAFPIPSAQAARRTVRWQFLVREFVGGLGDLGTFVPIVIGLVMIVGMDAAPILVFAGVMNLLTGLAFGLPIAVQPMKAIAALAIAGALTPEQVAVAGIFVSVCLLGMTALGIVEELHRIIPQSVIGGIQLAVAVRLVLRGCEFGLFHPAGGLLPVWGVESLCMAGIAASMLVVLRGRWRIAALWLLLLGLIGAIVKAPASSMAWSITYWRPALPLWDSTALAGIWRAGIAQLPLTLLNSVFAVSLLASRLFPGGDGRARPEKIALSVGLMNLLTCPFGGMPVCHGSGGMAAQYACGARTGWSMVLLGAAKILIGLFFGAVALVWIQAFPRTVLGAFLVLAGFTLVRSSQFWRVRLEFWVAAATVGAYMLTGVLPIGFAVGWILHQVLRRRSERTGQRA